MSAADPIVIRFRGKVDGDGGVKVPRLTSNHLTAPARGMYSRLFLDCADDDITRVRLRSMYRAAIDDDGAPWPGYVGPDTPGFEFTPRGDGYMADITITLDAQAMKRRA